MTSEKDKGCGYKNCAFPLSTESLKKVTKMISLSKLNVILIIWISATHMWSCYPIVPSTSNNPFYLNCQLSGKSDYCLLLLNNCPVLVDGVEELALLKPFLEKTFTKRSFRNGVGAGIKKTSFQRAKS